MTIYNYGLCTSTVQKINRELFPLVRPLKHTDLCFEDITVFPLIRNVTYRWLYYTGIQESIVRTHVWPQLHLWTLSISRAPLKNWPFLSVCRWKLVSSHWLTSHINKNAMLSIVFFRCGVSVGLCLGLRRIETEWRIEGLTKKPNKQRTMKMWHVPMI